MSTKSQMYEQVISDTQKLREETKKYGYSKLLEEYAHKIDEAVRNVLEQDPLADDELDPEQGLADLAGGDDPLGGAGEALPPEPETALEPDPVTDKLPLAATEGEQLCACPEEDEEIEINFDDLMTVDDVEDPNDYPTLEESDSQEEDLYESEDEEEEELYEADEDEMCESDEELYEELDDEEEELYEDWEELEEAIDELAEELKVEFDVPAPTGWAGKPAQERERDEDLYIASMQDDKRKEDHKISKKAADKLVKENRQLTEQLEEIKTKNNSFRKKLNTYMSKLEQYEDIVKEQQEKLSSLTLMNSRLLYINKVLINESLNGKQKKIIVESIIKARNPGEAKLIFESLHSTVGIGGHSPNKMLKSRREVAENSSPQTRLIKSVLKESVEDHDSELISSQQKLRWQQIAKLRN